MTAAQIVRTNGSDALSERDFSREQLQILKNTLAPGASDAEFSYFIEVCRHKRLDPFSKQVHLVPRRQKVNDDWVTKWEVQTGIDGFRAIAQRTEMLDGHDGPHWCGIDGKWHDVWLGEQPPAAARVVVYRKDARRPFIGVALYREYVQLNRNGRPNQMWSKMPTNQLAKCAEALALRKAFPEELSGLYEHTEIAAREEESEFVAEDNTPKHDPDRPFGFGQWRETPIREMSAEDLATIAGKARTQEARDLAEAELLRRRQAEEQQEAVPAEHEELPLPPEPEGA